MPARNWHPNDDHPRPEGRCRTSLGGGNRGERQRGCSGRKRYGDSGSGLTITARMQAMPVCRCVWAGPGALLISRLFPSISQAIQIRSRRHACAAPVDGHKRIDLEDKRWREELFMTQAVRESPARASNCARWPSGDRSVDRQRLVPLRWTTHRLAHRCWG